MIALIELSGDETKQQCADLAWQTFCQAHPVEAYAHDPERFWAYFHGQAPGVTREVMVALLKSCEDHFTNQGLKTSLRLR